MKRDFRGKYHHWKGGKHEDEEWLFPKKAYLNNRKCAGENIHSEESINSFSILDNEDSEEEVVMQNGLLR